VEEVNLAVNISTLRKLLGENPQDGRYIVTVSGRGYRFVAAVRETGRTAEEDVDGKTGPGKFEKAPLATPPLRPNGRKWGIAAAIVLLLLAGIGSYLWRQHHARKLTAAIDASIAVLPFADLSQGKDQEYFSDGLADELTNDLQKIRGLKVIARSSAFQFKGKNEDLRTVGRKLGVANILEGSVRREGNRVRITAQ
jgi:hypothetical protein